MGLFSEVEQVAPLLHGILSLSGELASARPVGAGLRHVRVPHDLHDHDLRNLSQAEQIDHRVPSLVRGGSKLDLSGSMRGMRR